MYINRLVIACLTALGIVVAWHPGVSIANIATSSRGISLPAGQARPQGSAFPGIADRYESLLPLASEEVEPYSKHPAETRPFAVCPPPTKLRTSCMAALVPTEGGEPVVGPSLEGSGQLGGFSPADLRSAYNLPSEGGAGQTVAVTIAYDDPAAESDLASYRSYYGLPPCTSASGCFRKLNQRGEEKNYPAPNPEWALETSLDLDMVSAACPRCHIVLIEADSSGLEDMAAAVDQAAELSPSAISNSWAAEEFFGEATENEHFNHPGIPALFASGDWGYGVYYPAASPDVIAVGGTSLSKSGGSRGWSETAWSGAGSGCSAYEEKPAWQKDGGCALRTVADVSAVADPQTPVSVFDSYGKSGWELLGGTSVATPLMAGVEALSSSAFRAAGPAGFARAGNGGGLFDVTEGENGLCATESEQGFEATYLCQADVGYDGPTGWGTPAGPLSLPVAITEAAAVVSPEEAILHGSVDPRGLPTSYRFEYGETTSYGTSVPVPDESVGTGSGYVEVGQAIKGLKGQTPYHYRIVASNSAGTFHGVDRTIGTTPPSATTGAASEIHASNATLHATVDPEGLDTTYYFEYGPTTSYRFKAPIRAMGIGSGTEDIGVSTVAGGIAGGRTYHYRVVAKSAAGVVHGKDRAFITEPSKWTAEYLPQPANSGNGHLAYGVSCIQSDECIAVGENWSLDVHTRVTLAEAWNGKSWSTMSTPNPPGLDDGWQHEWYAVLGGVSCVSASDCVAVGRYRDGGEAVKPLAERWDGSEWTMMPVAAPGGATTARLDGVSCTSATECTAVGSLTNISGETETLAEQWDGSNWTVQSTPNLGEAHASWLSGVSCASTVACTAVGAYNTDTGAEKTLAERWDGSEWAVQSTPNPGARFTARLEGVSCGSSTACTAVGYFREGPTLVTLAERWDGSEWAVQSTPTPDEQGVLTGVSCTLASTCTAAGYYYSRSESDHGWRSLVERWSGLSWSVMEIASISVPAEWWHESSLNSVSCTGPKACTAVGAGLSAPPGGMSPYRALAEHDVTPPFASFSAAPESPIGGESVSFDASSSSDPGRTIETYNWDFGDGSHGTGLTPSHTYAHAGDYAVTLTVSDDRGKTAEVSHLVSVANAPPLAAFVVGTGNPTAIQPIAFDASSSSDADGTIESYEWDFGDGWLGTGVAPSHTYASAGNYTVVLTVTDDEGETAEVSHLVSVAAAPPPGPIFPNSGAPAQPDPGHSPSSGGLDFAIGHVAIGCNGQIVLVLQAPAAGRFSATAIATETGHREAQGRRIAKRRGGCGASRSRAAIPRWPAYSGRHNGQHRFAYGAGSAESPARGVVRLAIVPNDGALRAMERPGRLRIEISIAFEPRNGEPTIEHEAFVRHRTSGRGKRQG